MIDFNDLKDACYALKKYDKSVFNKGAEIETIEKWEKDNHAVIPAELKNLLVQSDGFQILGRTAKVYSLAETGYSYPGVPEKYVAFGEIVGDSEMLCFHESTGEIVSVYNGEIKVYSINAFMEYCFDQCLDGIFMSDTDVSGLNDKIKGAISGYRSILSSSMNNVIMSFAQASIPERAKRLFDFPVLIRTIVFGAFENSECTELVNYIGSCDKMKADNLIRGLRRRAIDNYFNRERKLLDDGKATYSWNVKQLKELYNFDDEGMSYQNAGEVKKYDAAGNPALVSVKSRNGNLNMINKKIDIGYINDIRINIKLTGNMNNIMVKG